MSFKHLSNKERSKKSEKAAAEKFGGRVQLASGALRIAKGDVVTGRFLIEDKVTEKPSFSVSETIWKKIRQQAFKHNKQPLIRITVEGNKTFCILEEDELLYLLSNQKDSDE